MSRLRWIRALLMALLFALAVGEVCGALGTGGAGGIDNLKKRKVLSMDNNP